MTKKLGFLIPGFIDDVGISRLKKHIKYFKKISDDGEFYLIDLSLFNFKKTKNYKKKFIGVNAKYFRPKSFKEAREFLSYDKFYLITGDIYAFSQIIIFFLLKLFKIKLLMINNRGFVLQSSLKVTNISSFRSRYILKKLEIFTYKIFTIFNFIQKIDYYFESSNDQIKILEKGKLKKIDKIFKINFFSPYKKIYRINSSLADKYNIEDYVNDNNSSNKVISVVDSGYLHPDKKIYENISFDKVTQNANYYYQELSKLLLSIKKYNQGKIIFCKHPRAIYKSKFFKQIENNFIVTSKNTEAQILKSDLTIFTGGSSLVNLSIITFKKILLIKSIDQSYSASLIESLNKKIKLETIDLYQFFKKYDNPEAEKKFFNKFNISNNFIKNEYKKYIYNNIVYKNDQKSYNQIKDIIFSQNVQK